MFYDSANIVDILSKALFTRKRVRFKQTYRVKILDKLSCK